VEVVVEAEILTLPIMAVLVAVERLPQLARVLLDKATMVVQEALAVVVAAAEHLP
jgi:hypothetical protein